MCYCSFVICLYKALCAFCYILLVDAFMPNIIHFGIPDHAWNPEYSHYLFSMMRFLLEIVSNAGIHMTDICHASPSTKISDMRCHGN